MDVDVSVVISTYNRSKTLARSLDALLHQTAGDIRYEVIVVDNNSTDDTREAIEARVTESAGRLKYVFEPRQGLSYGRNAGIANSRSQIIAFTDDDVLVAPDWIYRIKTGFDPEDIEFLGGKVLPVWREAPPPWLSTAHWAPLALIDYGDEPFYVDRNRRLCLVGANLAFRRRAFDQVGLFSTEFQRVKAGIGSLEDHEIQIRLWERNLRGKYLPQLVVTAEVETDRTDKQYHRRWHGGHGHFSALLREEEMERSKFRILGVPAHMYRRAIQDVWGFSSEAVLGHQAQSFEREMRLRFFAGFAVTRWKEHLGRRRSPATNRFPDEKQEQ